MSTYRILPLEEAKTQAEQAMAALVVEGIITTSSQEIDRLIEQVIEDAGPDRNCPACGLAQLEDDIEYCWCCGAELNPEAVEEGPTEPSAAPARTAVKFCGVTYILEIMTDEEFEDFFDRVIDHGCELVERAENWTTEQWAERKASYDRQRGEQSLLVEHLEREDHRRRTGQVTLHPVKCSGCIQVQAPARRDYPKAA